MTMGNEDKKISELPALETVSGDELLVVAKGGGNGSVTTGQIVAKARQGLVAQVPGKGLSTNDFTDVLKAKLDSLKNYDDAALRAAVDALEGQLDTILGDGASAAIDTFNEIEAFLTGITDTQTLTGLLAELKSTITGETDTKLEGKVDKVSGKGLSANDYSDAEKGKLAGLPTGAELETELAAKLDKAVWDGEHAQFGIVGYCHHSGSFSSASGYQRSGYLPINRKYDIRVYGHGTSIVCAIGFYDATFKFVGGLTYSGSTQTVTCAAADIPATAVYFVASTAENITGSYWRNGETMEAREGGVSEAVRASKTVLFDELVGALGVTKDADTGLYSLNGLTDITYDQMLQIWLSVQRPPSNVMAGANRCNLRTNLWVATGVSSADNPIKVIGVFAEWIKAETLNVSNGNTNSATTKLIANAAFRSCNKLKKILGVFRLFSENNIYKDTFYGCAMLEELSLTELEYSVSFADSPLLSLASLEYLVANAANTGPVTVTVHPDVYAKLTNTDGLEDYLPANMVKTQGVPVGYSPNCAYANGVWTIQRQDRDTWIEFLGEPVVSGLPYAVSMNVDGMADKEYWYFTFGGGDMKSSVFRMQQGPSSGVLHPKVSRHDIQFDNGSRSYVDMSLTTPITVTDIMVVPGETAAPKWAPHPDEIEDAELRERVKWANLVYVAAAKNISFATI